MAYERLLPGSSEWEMYYANHYSRYVFALQILLDNKSKKVLDAATGVGYGANLLSINGMKEVYAIDRDIQAIKIANDQFKAEGIHFIMDDCETFAAIQNDFPFDAVVSFETVEHLPNPDLFLQNCNKALVENGLLIISTPNKLVSSPQGKTDWAFHEKEYTAEELKSMLSTAGFTEIDIYGQQLTAIGKLRQQFRGELNRLNFNPFIRVGKWIQKILRATIFPKAILPEQMEDFEIINYSDTNKINLQGTEGPFVLIAVARKASSRL
jgi:SAM-dependent methyltransferase